MKDYCPHCRMRTEQVKGAGYKLCKRCSRQTKVISLNTFNNLQVRRLPF